MNSQVSTLEAPRPGAPSAGALPRAAAKASVKVNGHDAALSGKLARVTIHAGQGKDGQEAVFLGLNGYAYQVPRGTPVEIPMELLGVLETAVAENVTTEDAKVLTSNSPRYAYSVHAVGIEPAKVGEKVAA